ncbi:MAG TPA: hypothetical protein VNX29_16735 [Kaistia sp.]|nr:hypothetical protein [Kaistia sp.]
MIAPTRTAEGAGMVRRLYIEALQDRSVPIAVQRTMQSLLPGARIATVDTDHAPQLSCPDRVAAIFARFRQRHGVKQLSRDAASELGAIWFLTERRVTEMPRTPIFRNGGRMSPYPHSALAAPAGRRASLAP